jgi:hypothetical protein
MGPLPGIAPQSAPQRSVPPVFGRPEGAPAPAPPGQKDGFAASPELADGDRKGSGQIPAFNFGEPPATAEEKANPYRPGQDPASAREGRKKDQDLVDHVCGKGCGCSTSKAGGGDDPLKALETRDTEVRQHEQDHLAAAGEHARGGPEFETVTASNGKSYVVGGKVKVDTSELEDPEKTVAKMQQIQRAALAPQAPSAQDKKVAGEAAAKEQKALGKLRQQ